MSNPRRFIDVKSSLDAAVRRINAELLDLLDGLTARDEALRQEGRIEERESLGHEWDEEGDCLNCGVKSHSWDGREVCNRESAHES